MSSSDLGPRYIMVHLHSRHSALGAEKKLYSEGQKHGNDSQPWGLSWPQALEATDYDESWVYTTHIYTPRMSSPAHMISCFILWHQKKAKLQLHTHLIDSIAKNMGWDWNVEWLNHPRLSDTPRISRTTFVLWALHLHSSFTRRMESEWFILGLRWISSTWSRMGCTRRSGLAIFASVISEVQTSTMSVMWSACQGNRITLKYHDIRNLLRMFESRAIPYPIKGFD